MSGTGSYKGQTLKQLRHGVGVYHYPNKFFTYEGEWREGKKHGTGKLILGDGGYYEGAFVEGEIEGNGERLYGHSGAKYVGHFSKGERHGLGRYEESNGSWYEGNWFYNKKEGFGSCQQTDGTCYEGEWRNDKKHGEGVQVDKDGGRYEGDWVNGMRHGQGSYLISDKSLYEGQWKNDMYHEQRLYDYKGEWQEGKKHGTGKVILMDGGYYDGAFFKGEIDGNGERLYGHSGAKYVGHFSKGERHGLGRYEESNGSWYDGNWIYNLREGFGSCQLADGACYEGEWHNDIKQGEGVQVDTDGGRYEGDWVNGMRHGQGSYLMSDKSLYEGHWENDMYHEQGSLWHCSGIVRVCPWVKGEPFSHPVGFIFQCKRSIRMDHGRPVSICVTVVGKDGKTFEGESGRMIELKMARVTTGEDIMNQEWLNLLVRKVCDTDDSIHTTKPNLSIPLSSHTPLDEGDSPFKLLEPAQTVEGIVCFKDVYLPSFLSKRKEKPLSKLNEVITLISKVISDNTVPLSEGDDVSSPLSDESKARRKSLEPTKGQNRRNPLKTGDIKKNSSPKKSVAAVGKVSKFLSKNLIIAAIDVTENPFALRIPRKHHPVYLGASSALKLL